jgi:hypothetical protein
LHRRAFGNRDGENRDGSIHILKDGTLDQVFESLEKLLDLEFCPCGQAIFGDVARRFELETMLTWNQFAHDRQGSAMPLHVNELIR